MTTTAPHLVQMSWDPITRIVGSLGIHATIDFSARRVVDAFAEGIARGTASVNLDGKMVDIPVVKRAEVILARARVVAETERRKADALARLR